MSWIMDASWYTTTPRDSSHDRHCNPGLYMPVLFSKTAMTRRAQGTTHRSSYIVCIPRAVHLHSRSKLALGIAPMTCLELRDIKCILSRQLLADQHACPISEASEPRTRTPLALECGEMALGGSGYSPRLFPFGVSPSARAGSFFCFALRFLFPLPGPHRMS